MSSSKTYPLNLLDDVGGGKWEYNLPFDYRETVEYLVTGLSDTERRIIHGVYRDGKKQSEIAEEINISKCQVSQIKIAVIRKFDKKPTKDYLIYGVKGMETMAVKKAFDKKIDSVINNIAMIASILSVRTEPDFERIAKICTDLRSPNAIENFGFSVRTYNCLKRAGINTLDEIITSDPEKLRKIRNFGKQCYDEVRETLKELGYTIRAYDDKRIGKSEKNFREAVGKVKRKMYGENYDESGDPVDHSGKEEE